MDSEKVYRVLSALLTPLIACIALYIAWQQHITNRLQLRLALFDKRLAVFNSTMKLVVVVIRSAAIELNDITNFDVDTRMQSFLFDSDITAYLDQIRDKAVDLHAQCVLPQPEQDPARRTQLVLWFSEQGAEAARKFESYLKFKEP